jgi:type VI secretion system protein ImpC
MVKRTGIDVELRPARGRERPRPGEESAMRILVVGDFSTGARRAPEEYRDLARRRPVAVDLDNFERVMARIAPPPFTTLDAFHPDALYRRHPAFQKLRETRQRMQNPATFAEAAAGFHGDEPDSAIFARLVGEPAVAAAQPVRRDDPQDGRLQALIREAVAPHIVPGAPPHQALYIAAVDAMLGEQMRAIVQDPQFRALEATWRGMRWLVSNLETDEQLKLYLLDASEAELAADLEEAKGNIESSALYRLLVGQETAAPDGEPWSLIVGMYAFGPGGQDIVLLAHLGTIASQAGGPLLAAAKPELVGCASVAASPDPRDWTTLSGEAAERWSALRKSSVARWIGLALPRVLLRLPYGRASDPVASFPFEELAPRREHESYLWGNGALACALLVGRAFQSRGWDMEPGDELELDELPSHVYEADGEKCLQACAEAHLPERAVQAILDAGLMPLVSYRNRNAVRVPRFQSISSPAQPLSGPWR